MNTPIVAVVGLGYGGLPRAVEFGKIFEIIGFDLSEGKIANYKTWPIIRRRALC
jgi:UDP-N-acetyl-D-galactosamine dehydrogenase